MTLPATLGDEGRTIFKRDFPAVALLFALIRLSLQFAANLHGGYGYFRDELYYIACTQHLDWGYVDHPPLSIFVLAASRSLFGDSIFALRFLPALAAAAVVFLTGLMTRQLGGGRFAETLTCAAVAFSPIYLAFGTVYSMNTFDVLFWTLAFYIVIRLIKSGSGRNWIVLGVILGLGLLNRTSVLWLASGLFAGTLLTRDRHWFSTRWPWLAGAIALIILLPYILWNAAYGLPHLEFIRNAVREKYSSLTPGTFLLGQVLLQNPVSAPIWLAGIFALVVSRFYRDFRILGYGFLIALAILLVNVHSKAEYLSPAYTILFASGSVMIEHSLMRLPLRWLRYASVGTLLTSGLLFAPLTLPILPVETYIGYANALGAAPSTPESKELGRLPQFYADMFGWENLAHTVARVYDRLAPDDRTGSVVFTRNYGEAAAIDFFGKNYHLPKAISGHNSYWLWGYGSSAPKIVVVLGGSPEKLKEVFETVEAADTIRSEYVMPYENNLPVFICRTAKVPLDELWLRVKHYE